MATDILIHDKKDNVGVVVIEKITPKQDCKCWIMEDDSSTDIQSMDEIPASGKISEIGIKAEPIIPKACSIPCICKTFTKASSVVIFVINRTFLNKFMK